jgi:hypothetical protein
VFIVSERQNLTMRASIIRFLFVVAIGFAIILVIALFGDSTTSV